MGGPTAPRSYTCGCVGSEGMMMFLLNNPSLPLPPPLPPPLSLPPATTVAANSLLFHRSANNNKDNNKNNNAEPAAASVASTLCLSINILQNNRAEISWAKQIIGEVTD